MVARIPLFDQNQIQIARAATLLEQAKRKLIAKKAKIETEVYTLTQQLTLLQQHTSIYEKNIEPALTRLRERTGVHVKQLQVSPLVVVQTKLRMHELFKRGIDLHLELAHTYTELERALGRSI